MWVQAGWIKCIGSSYTHTRMHTHMRVHKWASLEAQTVKHSPAIQETWVWSLSQEDPWRRKWQPTPIFLPGKSHEQRSPAGYSPWGHKQLDMTEQWTRHTHTFTSSKMSLNKNCHNFSFCRFMITFVKIWPTKGNFLVVQWSGPCALTAGGRGSVPG